MQVGWDAAIGAIREEFSVEVADCAAALREAYQLRCQVYCKERGYETASGDIETDDFDRHAHHVLVRHQASGRVVGTARLVVPTPGTSGQDFPMQLVCDPHVVGRLPLRQMAEISRFILSRTPLAASPASHYVLRLSLMRGLAILVNQHSVTHLCALLEPSLCRLLRASAIRFRPIGPLVDHHGLRQLAFCQVDELLDHVQQEQPGVWDFITDGGRLWNSRLRLWVGPRTGDPTAHGATLEIKSRSPEPKSDARPCR